MKETCLLFKIYFKVTTDLINHRIICNYSLISKNFVGVRQKTAYISKDKNQVKWRSDAIGLLYPLPEYEISDSIDSLPMVPLTSILSVC